MRHWPSCCCASVNDSEMSPESPDTVSSPVASIVAAGVTDRVYSPSATCRSVRSPGRYTVTPARGFQVLFTSGVRNSRAVPQLSLGPEPAAMNPSTICCGVASLLGPSGRKTTLPFESVSGIGLPAFTGPDVGRLPQAVRATSATVAATVVRMPRTPPRPDARLMTAPPSRRSRGCPERQRSHGRRWEGRSAG